MASLLNLNFRLLLVSFCLLPLLGACSSVSNASLSQSFWRLFSDDYPSAEYIAKQEHPALVVESADNRSSLYILALHDRADLYWQGDRNTALRLHNERLAATGGFNDELLSIRYSYSGPPPWQRALQELPAYYEVEAYYKNMFYRSLKGHAMLRCKPTREQVKLPLATLALTPCIEEIEWNNGKTTHNYLWREPATNHLRQAEETPWPGASTVTWKAAKPW